MEELFQKIKDTAAKEARSDNDDFMVDDYAGGNIDDAYQQGTEDGEIWFARELLDIVNKIIERNERGM